jgi:hypothetical protein
MTVKFAPIDGNGYRIPVAQLSRKDLRKLMALDTASLDNEEKDAENTNNREPRMQGLDPRDPATYKPKHKVSGGLVDNYRPAEDDEDGDLSAEQVEALCEYCEETLGFSPESVKALRGRLSAKQAEDDDQPDPFRGEPLRGGGQRAMDAKRVQMAMDRRVGSFASRNPDAARITAHGSTFKRDRAPSSLAMDQSSKAKGFAARFPDAARIKFAY